MASLKPNETFAGRFILLERIGYGGFSEVWKVKRESGFVQAIKIFSTLDEEGIHLAREEFERVFNLNHHRILKSSDFDVHDDKPYLVMPYYERGSSLRQAGKLGEHELAKVMFDISSALAFLHGQENFIIHQDVKPDNFLIDNDGNYLLADFGISTMLRRKLTKSAQSNRETQLITDSRISGTAPPAYRPPETFSTDYDKRQPIKASDIWAFGASLHELATGHLPFGEFGGLIQKQGAEIPDLPPSQFSKELDYIVKWCLKEEPWDRPTAAQLHKLADGYLKSGAWAVEAPPPPKEDEVEKVIAAEGAVRTVPVETVASAESAATGGNKINFRYAIVALAITAIAAIFYFLMASNLIGKKDDGITDAVGQDTLQEAPASVALPDEGEDLAFSPSAGMEDNQEEESRPETRERETAPAANTPSQEEEQERQRPDYEENTGQTQQQNSSARRQAEGSSGVSAEEKSKMMGTILGSKEEDPPAVSQTNSPPAPKPTPPPPPGPTPVPDEYVSESAISISSSGAKRFLRNNIEIHCAPSSSISTKGGKLKEGSYVEFKVKEPVQVDGVTLIGNGARLAGNISEMVEPGSDKATIVVKFTSVEFVTGKRKELRYAVLKERSGSRSEHLTLRPESKYTLSVNGANEKDFKMYVLSLSK